MARILFSTLMLIHGLIHLFGFARQWNLAEVSLLNGKSLIPVSEATARTLGAAWFVAYVLFMLASLGYYRRHTWWMPTTLVALILSQALIFFYWPDAKAGTLVNILIALALASSYAKERFGRQIDSEIKNILPSSETQEQVIYARRLTGLPIPVQLWLTESGVVGSREVATARLLQEGEMRLSPEGRRVPIKAEQFIRVDEPGFVWKANLRMFSFLPVVARDKYIDGKGHMLVKAFSMFPFVSARGPKIDQGSLLRFLGEICWVPSAALGSYIRWEAVDDNCAKATMTYGGISASAIFCFDERHRLVSVSANRYMGGGEDSQLTPWVVTCQNWQVMQGVKIPVQGYVTWELPTGDFKAYDWEITDITYASPAFHQPEIKTENDTRIPLHQTAQLEKTIH
ncbi:DUF6544 family protein [Salmonirosea aquatica]|uniref:Uncharacterized protein n=1 Tax=Salmonirosea aquatica TaxID=2654236 RepID=A0A7C9FY08_9BACT|nr:hypothetical protein [Cytophagaceae bacterium SJW1-29]